MTDNERLIRELTEGLEGSDNQSLIPAYALAGMSQNQFPPQPTCYDPITSSMDLSQWVIMPNGCFRPGTATIGIVPPGAYSIMEDQRGQYLSRKDLLSDTLIDLPDSVSERAVERARKFWLSGDRYKKRGLLFKTGMLFFGPPGSGKTSSIHMIVFELIQHGGITLFSHMPVATQEMLKTIRKIEPDRPLIVVFEDIDEMIREYGESKILSVLDGDDRVENVIFMASTNYINKLGARIVNRPARFDEPIYVGMPTFNARRAYLEATTRVDGVPADVLDKWAQETDGLSIAHLRELVAAVVCLEQPYENVLKRLQAMMEMPKEKSNEGFRASKLGY